MINMKYYRDKIGQYKRAYLVQETGLSLYTIRLIASGRDDTVQVRALKMLDKFFATKK